MYERKYETSGTKVMNYDCSVTIEGAEAGHERW